MDENKIKYGLKNVYYAKATFDENGDVSYEPPVHIPGAVSLSLDAEGEPEPWYADNMVYTVLNGSAGYSGDLEIAIIPESFATDILHEELDDNGLMAENTSAEIEHFALLFQFEGDKKAIRHVFYNCTCSRPAIESATTEDTKEPQTDTLALTAMPLANGYVKGKTCSKTLDGIYNAFFDEVILPGGAMEPHTVYFYNGDTLLQTVYDVPYGGSATYTGSTPTKTGYNFIGWDPEPTNITEDTYCYAQFEIKIFSVSFYNGSTLLQTVENVPYGGSATYTGSTPVSPDNPDLRFLGWDPEPTNITKDTKCYAQFEAQTYTVYFYDGDTLLQTVTGVQYGGSATYTGSTPEKEGYTFTGWDPEPVNITEDTKCYAQFEALTYTVYFYNGSTLLQTVTGVSYGGSASYTGSTPEKEGYTFTGWDPEPTNIKEDTKCYAQFEAQTFTVYFYDGDTLLQTVTGVAYGGSAAYTASTPEKTGYTFTGWDPEPVNITADTKCYAQFAAFVAFAVYSDDDSSLIFYADSAAPDAGQVYNGKTATAVYTGLEETSVNYSEIPWYANRRRIKKVEFDSSFSSVQIRNMTYWFYDFYNCTSIDFSNINTSSVVRTDYMFRDCRVLTDLDLSPLDTKNTSKMGYMFEGCIALTSLDLTSFELSSIDRDMRYMFRNCSSLTKIKLPTIKSTSIFGLFYNCSSLSDIDLSVFNTKSVTNMTYMFYNCSSLTALDLSPLDLSDLTNMSYMFEGCSGLKKLDLSPFASSRIQTIDYAFDGCSGLTELDLTPLDTSNVTKMNGVFMYCSGLNALDLSPLDSGNVKEMYSLFCGCSGLRELDLSPLNTSLVTDIRYLFSNCSGLKEIDLSPLDTRNVTGTGFMFNACSGLTEIDVSMLDTSNVTNMQNMFRECSNLTTIYSDDSKFVIADGATGSGMFTGCWNLVGGNGTVFDNTKLDISMAHVDTEGNPGYFTAKG